MTGVNPVRVVEVQITNHYAIGKSRQLGRTLMLRAQYHRAGRRGYVQRMLARDPVRIQFVTAHGASQRVYDMAFEVAHYTLRQAIGRH